MPASGERRASIAADAFAATAGTDQGLLFRYVHEHVREKGEDWQRTRHYLRSQCGRPFLDDEETRSALEEDGEQAVVTCTNRKCKAEIALWDAIEQKFASDEFKNRVRALREASLLSIDNESRELILEGHARTITGQAGQIYRAYTNSDHGIDGEIEFKDDEGHATGERLYLQLKSGDSYLRDRLRDRTEVFDIKKPRWAEYWVAQRYPVMLVIRTSDGRIRWFNATEYLREKNAAGEWPVSQIIFEADDFSVVSILETRRTVLQRRLRRMKPDSEPSEDD